ncbi:MAG: hypothetical protein AAFV53_42410 [Myxococcota bacterium]
MASSSQRSAPADGVNPDAIGWRGDYSILVECKTSRSDFFADKKKAIFRFPDRCPGQERWYLTPKGLVKPREVPKGWGLAEVRGRRIIKVKQAQGGLINERRARADVSILYSAMRRVSMGVPFDAKTGRFPPYNAEAAK